MKRIAVILARGGSKRIPRKNIVDFFGKPMLAWTIEAAINSNEFERIVVSTDDEEIAEISNNYGIEVPFLRQKAADDISPSSDATLAALEQAESYWKESYCTVAQLMPNCPLRDSEVITQEITKFINEQATSQISCCRFGWMNPWWAVELDKNKVPKRIFPDALEKRSQDLPPLYFPSGAIWISEVNTLKAEKTFYSKNHTFSPVDWFTGIDIDDEGDLEMAKACFLLMHKQSLKLMC